MSLADLDENDSDSTKAAGDQSGASERSNATVVGHATATPAVIVEAPISQDPPRLDPEKSARTRAGKEGKEKDGKEKFRLPAETFDAITEAATQAAVIKATRNILEDEGLARHIINAATAKVLENLKASKAPETARTPTLAAPPPLVVVSAPITQVETVDETVVDEVSRNDETTSKTAEKEEAPGFFARYGVAISCIALMIAFIGIFAMLWPDAPRRHQSHRSTTSTTTETTTVTNGAEPIASDDAASTTEAAIQAFAARVPYSLPERLTALRELRGTSTSDMRDMDCSESGINFSTRAFIERSTPSGTDRRAFTISEAQAYFADTGHTGQHVIDSVDGPRYYTVYLDLRDREGEPGHCNFFVE